MIVEPCTCNPILVRSSREGAKGAELVDATNERGRWHAVRVAGVVYLLALVAPSADEAAREDAARVTAAAEGARALEDSRLAEAMGPKLMAALALRAWPDATAAERTWAAGVIEQAGQRIRAARGNA